MSSLFANSNKNFSLTMFHKTKSKYTFDAFIVENVIDKLLINFSTIILVKNVQYSIILKGFKNFSEQFS